MLLQYHEILKVNKLEFLKKAELLLDSFKLEWAKGLQVPVIVYYIVFRIHFIVRLTLALSLR